MLDALSPSDLWTHAMSPGTTSALLDGLQPRSALCSLQSHAGAPAESSPFAPLTPSPCPQRDASGRVLSILTHYEYSPLASGSKDDSSAQKPAMSASTMQPDTTRGPTPLKGVVEMPGGVTERTAGGDVKQTDEPDRHDDKRGKARGGTSQSVDSECGPGGDEANNDDNGDEEDSHEDQGNDDDDNAASDPEHSEGSSPLDSPDGEDDDEEDDEDDEEEEEEDEESPFNFLQNFDPSLFATNLDALIPTEPVASGGRRAASNGSGGDEAPPPPGAATDLEFYSNMIQVLTHLLGSSDHGLWQASAQTPASLIGTPPAAYPYSIPAGHATPSGAASLSGLHATPAASASSSATGSRAYLEPARRGGGPSHRTSSQTAGIPDLQPLISALISKLGGEHHSPRRPVGEQDLTELLQSLMLQQQRLQGDQQQQHGQHQALQPITQQHQEDQPKRQPQQQFLEPPPPPRQHQHHHHQGEHQQSKYSVRNAGSGSGASSPAFKELMSYADGQGLTTGLPALGFADLVFEDEDEDDPDFNPDLNPDLPMPSAWSLAVQDVVGSNTSKAAAFATASTGYSPAATVTSTPALDLAGVDRYRHEAQRRPMHAAGQHAPNSTSLLPAGVADGICTSSEAPRASTEGPSAVTATSTTPAGTTDPFHPDGTAHGSASHKTPAEFVKSTSDAGGDKQPQQSRKCTEPAPPTSLPTTATTPVRDNDELDDDDGGVDGGDEEHGSDQTTIKKRGRKPTLTEEEKRRRRLERNAEYARAKRRRLREEREAERGSSKPPPAATAATATTVAISNEEAIELRVENKMLRSEVERLREENARLRAWKEISELEQERSRSVGLRRGYDGRSGGDGSGGGTGDRWIGASRAQQRTLAVREERRERRRQEDEPASKRPRITARSAVGSYNDRDQLYDDNERGLDSFGSLDGDEDYGIVSIYDIPSAAATNRAGLGRGSVRQDPEADMSGPRRYDRPFFTDNRGGGRELDDFASAPRNRRYQPRDDTSFDDDVDDDEAEDERRYMGGAARQPSSRRYNDDIPADTSWGSMGRGRSDARHQGAIYPSARLITDDYDHSRGGPRVALPGRNAS